MIPDVFNQLAADAHKALHQHHLNDALYIIDLLLKDVHHQEALYDCQQLGDNYAHMLQFIASGGQDEDCETMRGQMIEAALRLTIIAEREYRLQNGNGHYCEMWRKLCDLGENLESLTFELLHAPLCSTSREALLDLLFYAIWTSAPLSDRTARNLHESFLQMTETEQCTITSALTLALQEYTDRNKLLLLIQLLDAPSERPSDNLSDSPSDSPSDSVRVRALMGLTLCAQTHAEDTRLCTEATRLMAEKYGQRQDIQKIASYLNFSFLICLQTQSAHEKMQNDILPNFMKIAKNGRVELGFDEDGEIKLDLPSEDSREKRQIMGTMKDFVNMQQDGIDMNANNMRTLRNLPFFKELPHWFLPFDKNRTEIAAYLGAKDDEETASLFGEMIRFTGGSDCDTDRYSTTLMVMKHMGNEIKESLRSLSQIVKQKGEEALRQRAIAEGWGATGSDIKILCRKYMQQLYRVFTMWPQSKEWVNPFANSANWLDNCMIRPAIYNNRDTLHLLSDFLIKYENYREAEAYLNRLVQLEGSDASTLRSAAYCKQQQGKFGTALTLYNEADILEPEHSWTLSQMQLCYAHLDRQEQRLDCLLQLEKIEPENVKVISETGLCLMQLQRWHEASQRFFRLELEDRNIVASQRAIAWCSLQQRKLEQALRYYRKLMDSPSARWQDYLNAAHTTWLMGDTPGAISLYRGYIQRYLTDDPKITDALTPFNESANLLLSLGKTQHEIDLMHDILAPLTPEGE